MSLINNNKLLTITASKYMILCVSNKLCKAILLRQRGYYSVVHGFLFLNASYIMLSNVNSSRKSF